MNPFLQFYKLHGYTQHKILKRQYSKDFLFPKLYPNTTMYYSHDKTF
jgi:hypothetical protein